MRAPYFPQFWAFSSLTSQNKKRCEACKSSCCSLPTSFMEKPYEKRWRCNQQQQQQPQKSRSRKHWRRTITIITTMITIPIASIRLRAAQKGTPTLDRMTRRKFLLFLLLLHHHDQGKWRSRWPPPQSVRAISQNIFKNYSSSRRIRRIVLIPKRRRRVLEKRS